MPDPREVSPAWSAERCYIATIHIFVGLFGLSAYALFLKAVSKADWMKSFSFLVKQLAIPDMCILLLYLFVFAPMTLTASEVYGILTIPLTTLDTTAWFLQLMTTLLIALNRFFSLMLPTFDFFFFDKHLYLTMSTAWICALFQTATSTIVGCPKVYDYDMYLYNFRCSQLNNTSVQSTRDFFMGLSMFQSWTWPNLVMIIYMVIFAYLKFIRKGNSTLNEQDQREQYYKELRLLAQGFIIGITIWAVTLAFWGIFRSPTLARMPFTGMFLMGVTAINCTVNPFVYFIFNKDVRVGILTLLKIKKPNVARVQTLNA